MVSFRSSSTDLASRVERWSLKSVFRAIGDIDLYSKLGYKKQAKTSSTANRIKIRPP